MKFVRKGFVDEDLDVDANCVERIGLGFDFGFRWMSRRHEATGCRADFDPCHNRAPCNPGRGIGFEWWS